MPPAVEVRDWLNLVYYVANELRDKGMARDEHEYDELVGDGMVALMRLASSYDPGRGVPFGPYAFPRLRWAMLDGRRTWLGNVTKGAHAGRTHPKPRAGFLPPPDPLIPPDTEELAMRNLIGAEVRAWAESLSPRDHEVVRAASEPGGLTALAKERGVSQAALSHALARIRETATTTCTHCGERPPWLTSVWCLPCIRAVCCNKSQTCIHRQRHPEAF